MRFDNVRRRVKLYSAYCIRTKQAWWWLVTVMEKSGWFRILHSSVSSPVSPCLDNKRHVY
jgi:hypothetical protein